LKCRQFFYIVLELSVRPDLNDLLIPEHARHHDGDGDLADFENMNLSEHPVEAADTSFLGKFRSSLKKKVSIKRLSDIVKSPHKAGSKKEKTASAETQQTNQDEAVEQEVDGNNDVNLSHDFSGSIDIETREDTGEMPAPDDEALDTSVAKKKKKKKKKQRDVQHFDEAPVDDVDYAANGETEHLAQSLDASGYDTDDVDNGHVSVDHTTEVHQHEEEHEVVVVTKTTKTKKHRQKTHRTQKLVADEEPEEL